MFLQSDGELLNRAIISKSTKLILNDEVLITVNSPEFAILYSGIWLHAEQPLDAGLRHRLLASLMERRGS